MKQNHSNRQDHQRRSHSQIRFTQAKAIFQTQTTPMRIIENEPRVYFKGNVKFHQTISYRSPLQFKSGQTRIHVKRGKITQPTGKGEADQMMRKEVHLVQVPLSKNQFKITNYIEKNPNAKKLKYVRYGDGKKDKRKSNKASQPNLGAFSDGLRKRGVLFGRPKSSLKSGARNPKHIEHISRTLEQNQIRQKRSKNLKNLGKNPSKKRRKHEPKTSKKQVKIHEYKSNKKKTTRNQKKIKKGKIENHLQTQTSFVPEKHSIVVSSKRYSRQSQMEPHVKTEQTFTRRQKQKMKPSIEFIENNKITLKSTKLDLPITQETKKKKQATRPNKKESNPKETKLTVQRKISDRWKSQMRSRTANIKKNRATGKLDLVESNVLFPQNSNLEQQQISHFIREQAKSASKSQRNNVKHERRIREGVLTERKAGKSQTKKNLKFTFREKMFVSQNNNYVEFFTKNLNPPLMKKSKSITEIQDRRGRTTKGGFAKSESKLGKSGKSQTQFPPRSNHENENTTRNKINGERYRTDEQEHLFKKEMAEMPTIFNSEIEILKKGLVVNNK